MKEYRDKVTGSSGKVMDCKKYTNEQLIDRRRSYTRGTLVSSLEQTE